MKLYLKRGRYLFSVKDIHSQNEIVEIAIIEYSPAKKYIKIQHLHGRAVWLSIEQFEKEYIFIERLGT